MPTKDIALTLIGGPTVLVEYGGLRFLTDPTFDHSGHEYTRNGVTLKKTADPVLAPEALGKVDAVLLSHDQHADNLDDHGREFSETVPVVLTTPVGAGRLQGNARGLAVWQTETFRTADGKEVRITATPCRHGPAGIEPVTGDVTGFMLEMADGSLPSLYVTGDTVYYEGVAEVARRFSPGFILAFAGAARVRGPIDLTMSANDLLDTANAFPQSLIIPVHTEGWAHFTQAAEEVAGVFGALGLGHRIRTIKPGERTVLG